ncbi:gamma-interferon-inducible lysosomal thiol reductase [Folsomia candida]|uniref:gamma-interferon-inducible lysosomal thiol reductase n=1 Tax=Folsomia candida TaxID=158441 RepID=UPI000B901CBA|nr:gamma-interferon-inducible lysosomal thiol reductase [Folsomia candida]
MTKFCGAVVLLTFLLSCSPIKGYRVQIQESPPPAKLVVNLYYESLCPDCQDFSRLQLCPTWEKMGQYFNIEFIPYGNAQTNVSASGEITISCQHGDKECAGNRLHSCALHVLHYKLSTKFICCMESSKDFDKAGPECAKKLHIDFKALKTCADSSEGNYLHYLNGVQTSKLDPPHEWVPWILFNSKYNKDDMAKAQDDLVSVLCEYLADPKPRECNEIF